MFDQLSDNLQSIFKTLSGASKLTDENIDLAIEEIRKALINADVSLKAIKTFTTRVREKAVGQEVIKGILPSQQFVKVINDELIALLGNEQKDLNFSSTDTNIILMLGLQGAGKTTSCAKLAKNLKKRGKNPFLVPLDLKRPAAIEQLTILGKQIEIPVYEITEEERTKKTPHEHASEAIEFAKINGYDVVILDSAGRLQIDTEMMAELLLVDRILQPQEKLLVIDSMIGQEAANVAAAFNTQIGITGVILTKIDGDARGGAALSVVEEINKPIKFVGAGEKVEDLQEFYPDRIASRILGMGDVLTLVEQAQERIQEEEAIELQKKLMTDFNFDTFLQVLNTMNKMGNLSNVFNMMGMGGMLGKAGVNINRDDQQKLINQGEVKFKKYKSAIQSMTMEERVKPNILSSGRKRRVAKGSGLKEKDLEQLVTEFKQVKNLMDNFKPLMGMMQGAQGLNPLNMSGMGIPGFPQKTGPSVGGPKSSVLKGFKPKKHK